MKQFHHAKPDSNRSKKRRQKRLLDMNDHEAILASHIEYKNRQLKKDGRKTYTLTEKSVEKLYGQNTVKTTVYRLPDPTHEQLVNEALRLYHAYVSQSKVCHRYDRFGNPMTQKNVTVTVAEFFNAAYHNLTSYGNFIEQTKPSKVKQELLDLYKPVEKKSDRSSVIRLIKH